MVIPTSAWDAATMTLPLNSDVTFGAGAVAVAVRIEPGAIPASAVAGMTKRNRLVVSPPCARPLIGEA